jgi:hypothetical protein
MASRLPVVLLVTVLFFGCRLSLHEQPIDDPGVILTMDRDEYALGDTAYVAVSNHLERAVLFALTCDAFVEGRRFNTWETVFAPDCSRIRVRATSVQPGEDIVVPYIMEPCEDYQITNWNAFRMRLRFQLSASGGYDNVFSEPFNVTRR